VTFDDEVLFDAHRLTGSCVPPHHLDLVAVGNVVSAAGRVTHRLIIT
jgi:hypothetical protein